MIGQNIVKRTRENTYKNRYSKERESPLGVYLGTMLHAKTRKKGIVDKLYDLGLSIPYARVMEISTAGNKVLEHYRANNVVCPPSLKFGFFTTAAVDNIDHDPSSKTSEDSFHGTGFSLFQHPTSTNKGVAQILTEEAAPGNKLAQLPAGYVRPITSYNREPDQRDYSSLQIDVPDLEPILEKEEKYMFVHSFLSNLTYTIVSWLKNLVQIFNRNY